jgi:protease I
MSAVTLGTGLAPSAFTTLLTSETGASVPRISAAQMFNAPENAELLEIWTNPGDATQHAGKRVAVIATDGVEEIELMTVLHYFKTRGATVDLISPSRPRYPAFLGLQIPAARDTQILTIRYIEPAGWIAFDKTLDTATASDYDAFIVPGGCWNPDTLRADAQAINLLQQAVADDKIVAAICHGPWVLSDAGLLRNKRATAWWSTQRDLEHGGATFLDQPVVVDGKIVTSRAPIDLAPFVKAIGDLLLDRRA